jgi:hypothetical protein
MVHRFCESKAFRSLPLPSEKEESSDEQGYENDNPNSCSYYNTNGCGVVEDEEEAGRRTCPGVTLALLSDVLFLAESHRQSDQ